MNNPIQKLKVWMDQESKSGNTFPLGAVLGTVSKSGFPRTRMITTKLDENGHPKFHTSSNSRKIEDINSNNRASLTYSFQNNMRSVTIEGKLIALKIEELNEDWDKLNDDFRRHYVVSGAISGDKQISLSEIKAERDSCKYNDLDLRPESFLGYKFEVVDRIFFYSVSSGDFSESNVYEILGDSGVWISSILVP